MNMQILNVKGLDLPGAKEPRRARLMGLVRLPTRGSAIAFPSFIGRLAIATGRPFEPNPWIWLPNEAPLPRKSRVA
jgi:hypothetical protein